jgi:hypothetical protein
MEIFAAQKRTAEPLPSSTSHRRRVPRIPFAENLHNTLILLLLCHSEVRCGLRRNCGPLLHGLTAAPPLIVTRQ